MTFVNIIRADSLSDNFVQFQKFLFRFYDNFWSFIVGGRTGFIKERFLYEAFQNL